LSDEVANAVATERCPKLWCGLNLVVAQTRRHCIEKGEVTRTIGGEFFESHQNDFPFNSPENLYRAAVAFLMRPKALI
jgi:hypothetical protein